MPRQETAGCKDVAYVTYIVLYQIALCIQNCSIAPRHVPMCIDHERRRMERSDLEGKAIGIILYVYVCLCSAESHSPINQSFLPQSTSQCIPSAVPTSRRTGSDSYFHRTSPPGQCCIEQLRSKHLAPSPVSKHRTNNMPPHVRTKTTQVQYFRTNTKNHTAARWGYHQYALNTRSKQLHASLISS